jgi:DNA-directed RNA polymerase specialized sigma24 family protein
MIEEGESSPKSADEDGSARTSSARLASGWRKLLAQLDADPVEASRKFEALRARLIDLARWRGARVPQDIADEALERAAKRLEGAEIPVLTAFLAGVVRNVVREDTRGAARHVALDGTHVVVPAHAEHDPEADRCVARCLDEQPAEQRELLLRYLGRERGQRMIDQRAALAGELGLTGGALRMKVYRVRLAVELCVRACLGTTAKGQR